MFLFLMLSCRQSEVGIIGVYKEKDTSNWVDPGEPESIGVGEPAEPAAIPETSESIERQGVSGITTMSLMQLACPACMGESQELFLDFEAIFHDPISDSHVSWIPQNGTCTDQLYESVPSTRPMSVGGQVSVSATNHSFSAGMVGDGTYYNPSLWEAQLQRNSFYTVNTDAGSYMFKTVEGFDWIEPYTMLWVDPSYAFEAPVYRSGFTVTWSPARPTSRMMVTVAVYTQDGAYLQGQVSCFGEDNGSMFIPAQYLNYPVWSLVAIHIERFEVDTVETDINNSYIETLQSWQVVGTGHIE